MEFEEFDAAEFERMIDKVGIVFCRIAVFRQAWKGGGGLPALRQIPKLQFGGLPFLAFYADKQTGSVEKAAFAGEVGAAYGEVVCINRIADLPIARRSFGLPAVFGGLGKEGGTAVATGFYGDDVPGKITNHIAAGNPIGQTQYKRGRACMPVM